MEKNAQACHSNSNAREEYRLPAQFSYDYSSSTYGYPVSPPPPATQASDAAAENIRKSRCPPKVKMVVWVLCVSISLVFLLVVFIVLVTPTTYLPGFQIESFSISNLTIYENQISANWTIGLLVANPNKRAQVSYDNIQVGVAYSKAPDDALSYQEKSDDFGFVQKPENQAVIYLELGTWLKGLNNMVANWMTGDVSRDVILDLDFLIQIQSRTDRGWSSDGFYVITMTCKGIKVLISPANIPPKNATGHAPEIPEMEIDYLYL